MTRELREQVRFARPVSGGRNGWPVMRPGNKTPEQLAITVDPEAVGMPSYPRSSWHPNRSHWPEPWRLAAYGITAMGRTFWTADHPDHRPDGHAWRVAIDLDKSEVCIRGHWQRMEFGSCQQSAVSDQSEPLALASPLSSLVGFPEPHDGMTLDERQGHRRVRNERGDIVWRCGPGPGETLAEFTAWRQRLDEFFEQDGTNETHTLRAVTMPVIPRSKEKIQCG